MEQEYIDALVAHFNTLPQDKQRELLDSVWACYRSHEKLAYALCTAYTHPEYGAPDPRPKFKIDELQADLTVVTEEGASGANPSTFFYANSSTYTNTFFSK